MRVANYLTAPARLVRGATGRLRATTPGQWFICVLTVLLLAFLAALLLEPTVGRGGR